MGNDRIPPDGKPTVWRANIKKEGWKFKGENSFPAACRAAPTPTEQVAAGDALLRQRGLHRGDRGRENVRLLQHLRSVGSVQRAERRAVVELRSLVQLDHRELIPAGLGAPVFVLRRQTAGRARAQQPRQAD